MSRSITFFIVFIVFFALRAEAQPMYNQTSAYLNANSFWAWYNGNGLSFSQGDPVHIPTALQMIPPLPLGYTEGVSAVSDPMTGELLFYTDGRRIFNSNHTLMPNGDSLWGNFNLNAVQGSCIVPVIGEVGKYYVFSMGSTYENYKGLFYNIVDMALDGGLGDVVNGSKNVVVDTSILFNEAMIAIPGNNCNIWLLTHEAGTKNFRAYEITELGVDIVPVTSQGLYNAGPICHHLSVSPDRTKVMMTDLKAPVMYQTEGISPTGDLGPAQYSELARFDPNTGTIFNSIPIVSQFVDPMFPATEVYNFCGLYTSAFSPNGELLYLNQYSWVGDNYSLLAQVDISVHDSTSVNASHQIIDTLTTNGPDLGTAIRSFQDHIYVFYSGSNFVGRVNQPNNVGQLCDLEPTAIQLPSSYSTGPNATAPNDVVYAFGHLEEVIVDTVTCGNYVLKPAIIDADIMYHWNDNSTDTFLNAEGPGTYWVTYQYLEHNCVLNRTDSFHLSSGIVFPIPQITINVNVLGTTGSYSSYQWMFNGSVIDGATGSTYTVSENGNYQVIVSNEYGCIDTSEVYEVTNQTNIYHINHDLSIRVYPNPVSHTLKIDYEGDMRYSLFQIDGRSLIKDRVGKSIDMRFLPAGVYLLKIYDASGVLIYSTTVSKMDK